MSATIRQIVDDALEFVGEVAGTGVQQYGEDRMMNDAIRAFNMIFKKRAWEQYCKWVTITLDGTLGVASTDAFSRILDFEDFLSVHTANSDHELPVLAGGKNPNTLSGSRVTYWTSLHAADPLYAGRKLQFYPKTSTGSIDVHVREYPREVIETNWDWEDAMYFDRDMLVYATAFCTLVGDDTNPGAAAVAQKFLDMKYKDVTAGLANRPRLITGRSHIPTSWSVR